jgi:hypothetical protein
MRLEVQSAGGNGALSATTSESRPPMFAGGLNRSRSDSRAPAAPKHRFSSSELRTGDPSIAHALSDEGVRLPSLSVNTYLVCCSPTDIGQKRTVTQQLSPGASSPVALVN